MGMGNIKKYFFLGCGGLLSLPVLLLALIWGLHLQQSLQQDHGVKVPTALHGYNVIITGSTSGIGFEAALEFVRRGAHVIIHSSSAGRANKSATEVSGAAKYGGRASALAADLQDFDQVRRFAQAVPKIMPRVDILILNAAKMYGLSPQYGRGSVLMTNPESTYKSPTGHDSVLAVNHLGHYLLTELLIPILAHGATVVVMSAIGGWDSSFRRLMPPWGYLGKTQLHPKLADDKRIRWEQQGIRQYGFYAYHDSKLANFCYGRWLRRKLSRNTTVVIHDPGYVSTSPMMNRDSTQYQRRANRYWPEMSKLRLWHAKPQDGGRHMIQASFLTEHPVPDVVTTSFFPWQVATWFAPHSMEDRGRAWYVSTFSMYQKLTWGLHSAIGPQCDEEVQDRLMRWSAQAVAPAPRT